MLTFNALSILIVLMHKFVTGEREEKQIQFNSYATCEFCYLQNVQVVLSNSQLVNVLAVQKCTRLLRHILKLQQLSMF